MKRNKWKKCDTNDSTTQNGITAVCSIYKLRNCKIVLTRCEDLLAGQNVGETTKGAADVMRSDIVDRFDEDMAVHDNIEDHEKLITNEIRYKNSKQQSIQHVGFSRECQSQSTDCKSSDSVSKQIVSTSRTTNSVFKSKSVIQSIEKKSVKQMAHSTIVSTDSRNLLKGNCSKSKRKNSETSQKRRNVILLLLFLSHIIEN